MTSLAKTRLENTLLLFEEFKASLGPAAAVLQGVEAAFARRIRISPAQWSQLKGGHRSIGNKLARQFESLGGKPSGWLDERPATAKAEVESDPPALPAADGPRDAEERFAVGLFLTIYRANPGAAKDRLLDVLHGELAKSATKPLKRPG